MGRKLEDYADEVSDFKLYMQSMRLLYLHIVKDRISTLKCDLKMLFPRNGRCQ